MGSPPTPSPRYRVSLFWPVMLISLGVMFLCDEFVPAWGFHRTWPLILVIIGVFKLFDSGRSPRAPRGPNV